MCPPRRFVPFLFALVIAGFSLVERPRALVTTLAPDAFEGTRALAELRELAAKYPDRAPGSGAGRATGNAGRLGGTW